MYIKNMKNMTEIGPWSHVIKSYTCMHNSSWDCLSMQWTHYVMFFFSKNNLHFHDFKQEINNYLV